MITQVLAPTPTKDPLTTQDRQIISTIVNQSDYSKECQPESEMPQVSLELAVA